MLTGECVKQWNTPLMDGPDSPQSVSPHSLVPSALMSFTEHGKLMLRCWSYLIWLFSVLSSVPVSSLKNKKKLR